MVFNLFFGDVPHFREARLVLLWHRVFTFCLGAIEEVLQSFIILRYFFLTQFLLLDSLLMHQFDVLNLLTEFLDEIEP